MSFFIMSKLTKEELGYVYKQVTKLPDKMNRTLYSIVMTYKEGKPYFRQYKDATLSTLIMRQLICVKAGQFPYNDRRWRYMFIPTQLGYMYATKEKLEEDIDWDGRFLDYTDEALQKDEDDFDLEYSSDTETRMLDADDYLDLTDTEFLVRVLGLPIDNKINDKQKMLLDVLPTLKISGIDYGDTFIIANNLHHMLGFSYPSLHVCEEEEWCIKVFEYLKKHSY